MPKQPKKSRPADKPQPRPRGRPTKLQERWEKVTVILLSRQVAYLDRLAADIRERTGQAITRAELIRTLIDASAHLKIDPLNLRTSDELRTRLSTLFGLGEK